MAEQRKPVADAGFKFMNWTHRAVLSVTGGRYPRRLLGMAAVERRCPDFRPVVCSSTMLTSPIADENRVVLVASRGGAEYDPQWYKNLTANPDVEVTIDGETREMRARTASPEEKAALWPDIVKAYKGYASYQKRTARDIPVVICEPRLG